MNFILPVCRAIDTSFRGDFLARQRSYSGVRGNRACLDVFLSCHQRKVHWKVHSVDGTLGSPPTDVSHRRANAKRIYTSFLLTKT